MESTFNGMFGSRAMENVIEIKALERMNPHVRLEGLRKRLMKTTMNMIMKKKLIL